MALVLSATCPSAEEEVLHLRSLLGESLFFPDAPAPERFAVPTLRHVTGKFHMYTAGRMYIGMGSSDAQGRPSQWANPYFFLVNDPATALSSFSSYLSSRADLTSFLSPLA